MKINYNNELIGSLFGKVSIDEIYEFVATSFPINGDSEEDEIVVENTQISYFPENDIEFDHLVSFTDFPQSSLEVCKAWALKSVKVSHSNTIKKLTGNSTEAERDTWPDQREAAKAYINSSADNDDLQMLESLCLDHESKEELAMRILAKSKLMKILIGKAGGLKRKAEKDIESAKDAYEISVIMVKLGVNAENAIGDYLKEVKKLSK